MLKYPSSASDCGALKGDGPPIYEGIGGSLLTGLVEGRLSTCALSKEACEDIMSPLPTPLTDNELFALWLAFGVADTLRISGISKSYLDLLLIEGPKLVRRTSLGLESDVGCPGLASCLTRGFDCVWRRRMTDGTRCTASVAIFQ